MDEKLEFDREGFQFEATCTKQHKENKELKINQYSKTDYVMYLSNNFATVGQEIVQFDYVFETVIASLSRTSFLVRR